MAQRMSQFMRDCPGARLDINDHPVVAPLVIAGKGGSTLAVQFFDARLIGLVTRNQNHGNWPVGSAVKIGDGQGTGRRSNRVAIIAFESGGRNVAQNARTAYERSKRIASPNTVPVLRVVADIPPPAIFQRACRQGTPERPGPGWFALPPKFVSAGPIDGRGTSGRATRYARPTMSGGPRISERKRSMRSNGVSDDGSDLQWFHATKRETKSAPQIGPGKNFLPDCPARWRMLRFNRSASRDRFDRSLPSLWTTTQGAGSSSRL